MVFQKLAMNDNVQNKINILKHNKNNNVAKVAEHHHHHHHHPQQLQRQRQLFEISKRKLYPAEKTLKVNDNFINISGNKNYNKVAAVQNTNTNITNNVNSNKSNNNSNINISNNISNIKDKIMIPDLKNNCFSPMGTKSQKSFSNKNNLSTTTNTMNNENVVYNDNIINNINNSINNNTMTSTENFDARSQCCKCALEFIVHNNSNNNLNPNNTNNNNKSNLNNNIIVPKNNSNAYSNDINTTALNGKLNIELNQHQQLQQLQQHLQQKQQQLPQQQHDQDQQHQHRPGPHISVIGRHKNFQAFNHASLSSSSSSSSTTSSSSSSSSSSSFIPSSSSSSKASSSLSSSTPAPNHSYSSDQKFNFNLALVDIDNAQQYDFEDLDDDDDDEDVNEDVTEDKNDEEDEEDDGVVLPLVISPPVWTDASDKDQEMEINDDDHCHNWRHHNYHHHHHHLFHHHLLHHHHHHHHSCPHYHHQHQKHQPIITSIDADVNKNNNDKNNINNNNDDQNIDDDDDDDDDDIQVINDNDDNGKCDEGVNRNKNVSADDHCQEQLLHQNQKQQHHHHQDQQQQNQKQEQIQQRQFQQQNQLEHQIQQHQLKQQQQQNQYQNQQQLQQQLNQHQNQQQQQQQQQNQQTTPVCDDDWLMVSQESRDLETVQIMKTTSIQLKTTLSSSSTPPSSTLSSSTPPSSTLSSSTPPSSTLSSSTPPSSSSSSHPNQLLQLPSITTEASTPMSPSLLSSPMPRASSSSSSSHVGNVVSSSHLESSPQVNRIRKSSSLLVSKKKIKKHQKSEPNNDDEDDDNEDDHNKTINKNNKNLFVSSAQIDHVTTSKVDDVIKCSRSLPSQLNAKDHGDNKNDWRNVVRRPIRTEGKKVILDEIMSSVKHSKKISTSVDDSQILTRRVKRTIKSLFNMTPKLHKHFKRGFYIVSLVHQKGKVLVTSEDVLPTIEIQCEQTPSSIALKSDFYWLSKVICNWSNVKPLKNIFEKPSSITDSMHFRSCLLHAVYQMQKTVGFDDLGNLHYQLLNDPISSSQIFLMVKNLPDDIRVSSSLKWGSVNKLIKKRVNSIEKFEEKLDSQTDSNMMDYITANIPDLVTFNSTCITKLPRGLYVGYVKLTSYIDQLRIFVPDNISNVFPFVQVRENPKVLSEEWNSIINLTSSPTKSTNKDTTEQHNFINQLYESSVDLMRNVGVPDEEFLEHRIYTNEVFEFSSDVSFVLLMPNVKQVCSGLGEEEKVVPGYISLPLQQFEIYHMRTYHPDLTKRYALLSTLLEAEVGVSNHLVRQGVSSDDELRLRNEIQRLNQQQKKLDDAWKSMRWIAEVIGNARDSKSRSCLSLEYLKSKLFLDLTNNSSTSVNTNSTSTTVSSDVTQMSY